MKPKIVRALSQSVLPAAAWMVFASSAHADVLYTFAGPQLVDEVWNFAPSGNMDVSRSATDTGTLYFKYTVTSPGSYTAGGGGNGQFYAGMSLFNGGGEGSGLGKAWGFGGYSSFGTLGNNDFKSANGQGGAGTWQPISATDTTTIVFRIDFNANANDNVTVWVNPNLNLSEAAQSASLKTSLAGDCTFDRFYLREGGAGSGWTFSDVAIAENATDVGFFAAPLTTATWDGGGADSNWSSAANWLGDTAPSAGFDLIFPFSPNTSPFNDLTAGTAFTGLNFDGGASSYTLTGNAIGISNFVRNASANPQTVEIPLLLNGPLTLEALNSSLFIDGPVSGPHGITKTGGNRLELTANNTYTGNTAITAGTVSIGNGDVAGSIDPTGTVSFGSGTGTRLEILRSDDVTMANPITTGGRANIAAQGGGKVNLTGPITGAGEFWTHGPSTVQITPNAGSAGYATSVVVATGTLEVADFTTSTLGTGMFFIGEAGSGTLRYTGPTASTDRIGPYALQGTGTNTFIEVASPTTELTFTQALDDNDPGGKGLTKTGPGTLILAAAQTYTGDTVVEEGVLSLTQSGFADSSTVTVLEGGAKLDLDFVGSDTVTGIILGPNVLAPGAICTAISHPDYISGPGSLVIPSTATDYDNWETANGVIGGDNDDDDFDGLTNFQEYAFGLDPTGASSANPIAVPLNKATGTFSYTRRDIALQDPELNYTVWYSTDLTSWTEDAGAVEGNTSVSGEVETVPVTITTSLLSNSKLFIQVRAD